MSTTNRTPAATEQDRPSVRTSSRSGLADSALGTRNLMMIAALAVVCMILMVPLNYLAPAAGASRDAVLLAARSWDCGSFRFCCPPPSFVAPALS